MNFRKINASDKENASKLFRACLGDLIQREGIEEPGLLEKEVVRLDKAAEDSLQNGAACFYVAVKEGILLGTVALLPPGPLAAFHAQVQERDCEIGCVYVHPGHQRQGVGDFLFHSAIAQAKRCAFSRFFLDAGFSSSRTYWTKQLGEASITLNDYWGKGQPHAIWVRDLTWQLPFSPKKTGES